MIDHIFLQYVKYTKWTILLKELQMFITNTKNKDTTTTTTTTTNKQTEKSLPEPGIEPGTVYTAV